MTKRQTIQPELHSKETFKLIAITESALIGYYKSIFG